VNVPVRVNVGAFVLDGCEHVIDGGGDSAGQKMRWARPKSPIRRCCASRQSYWAPTRPKSRRPFGPPRHRRPPPTGCC
jgi:hypothetical protein